jgi:hypothetical protein
LHLCSCRFKLIFVELKFEVQLLKKDIFILKIATELLNT